jgi:hypothetical protein
MQSEIHIEVILRNGNKIMRENCGPVKVNHDQSSVQMIEKSSGTMSRIEN